jgi:hypothetical protein
MPNIKYIKNEKVINFINSVDFYLAIDASEKTTERGKWVKALGYELFSAVK